MGDPSDLKTAVGLMVSKKQYERVASYVCMSGTDPHSARHVASQIRAVRVAINAMIDDQQASFGGFKYSGGGRQLGIHGIESYLETRAILE